MSFLSVPINILEISFLVNPEIIEISEEKQSGQEGCLSYPKTFVDIIRHKEITVQYQDETLRVQKQKLTDLPARIVQHEVEHLEGVCRVGDVWRRENEVCAM